MATTIVRTRVDEKANARDHLRGAAARAGAMAGLTAGVLMGLAAMLREYATGLGFFFPLQQIAAVLFGFEALVGGGWVIFSGLLIHLLVSAILGSIFGAIMGSRALNRNDALLGGLIYGVVVWFVMSFLVLPWANPAMDARTELHSGWWFFYHIVYGFFLVLTPFYLHSMHPETKVQWPRRTGPMGAKG